MQCGAPENSTPTNTTVWNGRDPRSPGSVSSALHRPLLTGAGCALWDGLNIICLLALLQELSKQISMKPSMPGIPTAISAEAIMGMNLLNQPQSGSAWAYAEGHQESIMSCYCRCHSHPPSEPSSRLSPMLRSVMLLRAVPYALHIWMGKAAWLPAQHSFHRQAMQPLLGLYLCPWSMTG